MRDDSGRAGLSDASPSVQTHLGILQGVINRMAGNSASSKAWCITLVSAILVVVAQQDDPRLALLALAPTALFLTLDAYYLSLERRFRGSYNNFVSKVHTDSVTPDDLFFVRPADPTLKTELRALVSYSLWGFYGGLAVMILVAWKFILQ